MATPSGADLILPRAFRLGIGTNCSGLAQSTLPLEIPAYASSRLCRENTESNAATARLR